MLRDVICEMRMQSCISLSLNTKNFLALFTVQIPKNYLPHNTVKSWSHVSITATAPVNSKRKMTSCYHRNSIERLLVHVLRYCKFKDIAGTNIKAHYDVQFCTFIIAVVVRFGGERRSVRSICGLRTDDLNYGLCGH